MNFVSYLGPRPEVTVRLSGGHTYSFLKGRDTLVYPEHLSLFKSPEFQVKTAAYVPSPAELLGEDDLLEDWELDELDDEEDDF